MFLKHFPPTQIMQHAILKSDDLKKKQPKCTISQKGSRNQTIFRMQDPHGPVGILDSYLSRFYVPDQNIRLVSKMLLFAYYTGGTYKKVQKRHKASLEDQNHHKLTAFLIFGIL